MYKSLLLSATAMMFAFGVQGQKPYTLKSSKITVDGTSSVHDWTSDVTEVKWTGLILTEGNSIKEIKNVVVNIPVTAIKSTKGKTMDEKTYEAFKSEKNPLITYKLSGLAKNGTGLKADGSLTMAGKTKPITMTLAGKVLADGTVQLTGSHKLNMKDFEMTPPTAVLGTIKVGPEVTVKYDLILSPPK